MKAAIHPNYKFVVFRDITCNFQFITRSSLTVKEGAEQVEIDGESYPVFNVDISSESHPFYTGQQKIMDTEGRVEAYYRKYGFVKPPEPSDAE